MPHPMFRPRRLREKPLLRKMVRETALAVDDFVYPLFVTTAAACASRSARCPASTASRWTS